jgi:hypothetical protein
MTTVTERKAPSEPAQAIPVQNIPAQNNLTQNNPAQGIQARADAARTAADQHQATARKTRALTVVAISGIAGSIIVMIVASLNPGYWLPPHLAMPAIGPPWDVPGLHLPIGVVTVGLWLAAIAGACGVAAGLVAVRRGARLRPGWLLIAGLASAAILTVLPPAGSTDILDYATFGHIVTLGHSPYVWAPIHLRTDGSAFGTYVPLEWDTHVTLYGPLATLEQYLAALIGGSSIAVIVFWLKLWNAIAFAIVSLVIDRRLRADAKARLRAHLLWTANPLLLWGLIAAGHIDMMAAGAGLVGLLLLRPRAGERVPGLASALLAGLFLGAAADVKIPYILFAAAAAWTLRRHRKPLLALAGSATMVLVPSYLWFGPPAVQAVLARTSKVTADNFYQLFSRPSGFLYAHLFWFAVAGVLVLAVLLVRRLPGTPALTATPATPAMPTAPIPPLRLALALSCAWLFAWPYQLPWYDAMIICLLVFYPATQLDWIALIRLAAGTIALVPGNPYLHAGRLIDSLSQGIITFWAPAALLASAVVVVALSVTGRWRARRTDHPASPASTSSPMSSPIPVST